MLGARGAVFFLTTCFFNNLARPEALARIRATRRFTGFFERDIIRMLAEPMFPVKPPGLTAVQPAFIVAAEDGLHESERTRAGFFPQFSEHGHGH
jgi:hypothetical protein